MQFRHHTLDNGLEIVAEIAPGAYSSAYAFFVRTGSRDESDAISGVSHFLEHMVFKGSDKRSAADVNRDLDDLSASSNAFTSEEQTVYYATTLPEDQTKIVELLADMMRPVCARTISIRKNRSFWKRSPSTTTSPPMGRTRSAWRRSSARIRWAAACWARSRASAAWLATRCSAIFSSAIARGTWSSRPPAM